MEEVINRVMDTYGMMVNLTPREAQATRERLTAHLARMDADEKALAVEGLRFCAGQTVLPDAEWQGSEIQPPLSERNWRCD
jgi:hypothetical protein